MARGFEGVIKRGRGTAIGIHLPQRAEGEADETAR